MDVREYAKVHTNTIGGFYLRRVQFVGFFDFDHEAGEPRAGSLLLQDDAFDVVSRWNRAVSAKTDVPIFEEGEHPELVVRRIIDVIAFVFVCYRTKLARTLPLEPSGLATVLPVLLQHFQIFVNLVARPLCCMVRHVGEDRPLLFPPDEFRVLSVRFRAVVVVSQLCTFRDTTPLNLQSHQNEGRDARSLPSNR